MTAFKLVYPWRFPNTKSESAGGIAETTRGEGEWAIPSECARKTLAAKRTRRTTKLAQDSNRRHLFMGKSSSIKRVPLQQIYQLIEFYSMRPCRRRRCGSLSRPARDTAEALQWSIENRRDDQGLVAVGRCINHHGPAEIFTVSGHHRQSAAAATDPALVGISLQKSGPCPLRNNRQTPSSWSAADGIAGRRTIMTAP